MLGLPASVLGTIEGIADAVASFTKMASGYVADKLGHRKLLVLVGYGLTPLGQALIALAAGWPLILLGRMVSWLGKGLHGPLRDAIVIQAVTPETKGRAFGFHRAADTIGAVLGPLLGVALLGWAQGLHWHGAAGPFRLVLWLSVIPDAGPGPTTLAQSGAQVLQLVSHSAGALQALPRRGRAVRHRRFLALAADPGRDHSAHTLDGHGEGGSGRRPALCLAQRGAGRAVLPGRRHGGSCRPSTHVGRRIRAGCHHGCPDGACLLVFGGQRAAARRHLLRRRLIRDRRGSAGIHGDGGNGAGRHPSDELRRAGYGQRHGQVHLQRRGRCGVDCRLADSRFWLGGFADDGWDAGLAPRRERVACGDSHYDNKTNLERQTMGANHQAGRARGMACRS
nr:MFS transporter [Achromobacter piechaudii]